MYAYSLMIFHSLILTLLLVTQPLFSATTPCQDDAQSAFDHRNYKEALSIYQQCLQKADNPQERSLLQMKIATVLFKDQETESAFKTFLASLQNAPHISPSPMSPNEQQLYSQALSLYLSHSTIEAQTTANRMRQEYLSVLTLHPDYYMLNFLVAISYANLGMFEEFFPRFYESYLRYPDSFMAYKTKANLLIKLFERARTEGERQAQKSEIVFNTKKAIEKHPVDSSLYKILISFSGNDSKENALIFSIEKITNENIIIPRCDLPFYVNNALQYKQYALIDRFLKKAHEWYPSSQILTSLEEMVDQQKKNG